MPVVSRELLIDSVLEALPECDPATVRDIRETATRTVDAAGPGSTLLGAEQLQRVAGKAVMTSR